MKIIDLYTKLPWKGSMGRRKLTDIKFAIIHHDAGLTGTNYEVISKYAAQANYHIARGWKHLGYTFKISRTGTIYQIFPLEEIGVHAGNYTFFRNSIGICLDGSFDKQEPSPAQLKALTDLMAFLATKRPDMPLLVPTGFYGHREVRGVGFPGTKFFIPSGTFCPGKTITDLVKSFRTK